MRLGEILKLQETLGSPESLDHFSTREEVIDWVKFYLCEEYPNHGGLQGVVFRVNDSDEIVVTQSPRVWLGHDCLRNGKLPVKFEKWNGTQMGFKTPDTGRKDALNSMIGCPTIMNGQFIASGQNLSSLEGIPRRFSTSCDISDNPILSLQGIHKLVDTCITMILPGQVKSNALGLLRINDLHNVNFGGKLGDPRSKPELTEIMNKHLRSDKDVLECQEELITSGFKEYAKF